MLLQLFAPRPPLRWVEPFDHAPEKRQTPNIGGIAQYMQALKEYKDNDGYVPSDSWLQKRDRRKLEKKERQEKLLSEGVKDCTTSPLCLRRISCEFARSVQTLTSKQTNPKRIQGCKAMPSRRYSCRASTIPPPRMTLSVSSVVMVLLNAFALWRIPKLRLTRHSRSESVGTLLLSLSARPT